MAYAVASSITSSPRRGDRRQDVRAERRTVEPLGRTRSRSTRRARSLRDLIPVRGFSLLIVRATTARSTSGSGCASAEERRDEIVDPAPASGSRARDETWPTSPIRCAGRGGPGDAWRRRRRSLRAALAEVASGPAIACSSSRGAVCHPEEDTANVRHASPIGSDSPWLLCKDVLRLVHGEIEMAHGYLQHSRDWSITKDAIIRLSARLGRAFTYGELNGELPQAWGTSGRRGHPSLCLERLSLRIVA